MTSAVFIVGRSVIWVSFCFHNIRFGAGVIVQRNKILVTLTDSQTSKPDKTNFNFVVQLYVYCVVK